MVYGERKFILSPYIPFNALSYVEMLDHFVNVAQMRIKILGQSGVCKDVHSASPLNYRLHLLIFHAADSEATEELSALAEEYLKSYREEKEAFIASYAPKELEKIKNAEVRVFGNYVAYAILSADDGRIFFDTVEKLLRP